MSSRSQRLLTAIAVVVLVPAGLVVVRAASPPGVMARGRADSALLSHCVKVVLGVGRKTATPVSGSAGPQLVSHFAVFRRARSTADRLPAAARLAETLALTGATSYDPSAAVRLAGNGAHGALYAVPATVALPILPVGCTGLPQFAGVDAYLALQAQDTGSGPGACLISTQLEQSGSSGSILPGAKPSKPTRTLAVGLALCRSEAVLEGYVGALGGPVRSSGTRLALIPDGVSAITYALADGRGFTVPVVGNLATPPQALSSQTALEHPTAAELRRQLAARLPTTVTESGTSTASAATLTRPVSLISDTVGSLTFLRGLLTSGSASSSGSTSGTGASCSARTHRCVAVTVTTTCDSYERCQTSRTIHRYRYVGARPPAGTTGPNTQPTAPIVARINRLVTRPRRLTLVLSGAPQRQVVVLLSVNCFAPNSAASSGGPPLVIAVPSRSPLALPGPGKAFRACDVSALVTSRQHASIRVSVTRG